MHTTVTVPSVIAAEMQRLIDAKKRVENVKECAVLHTVTAYFDKHIEADIKVCNGDSGPWIDAVLFDDGQEIAVLEPSFEQFVGTYTFNVDGQEYVVELQVDDGTSDQG